MSYLLKSFAVACCLVSLMGCYPSPTDDDCCVIPYVNNPDTTGNKGSALPTPVKY